MIKWVMIFMGVIIGYWLLNRSGEATPVNASGVKLPSLATPSSGFSAELKPLNNGFQNFMRDRYGIIYKQWETTA